MTRGIKIDLDKYLARLKPFLTEGCSLHESCLSAKVPYTTMVDYVKKDDDIRNKIDAWQNTPILAARKSLNKGVKEDSRLALMYLERKKKGEFSVKQEYEHSGDITVTVQKFSEKVSNDEKDGENE